MFHPTFSTRNLKDSVFFKNNFVRQRRKLAEKEGIDIEVWQIHYNNEDDFPKYEGFLEYMSSFGEWVVRKNGYKLPSETGGDYISRLIKSGKTIESEGVLYVVRGNIFLDFESKDGGVRAAEENVSFFDEEKNKTGLFVGVKDSEGCPVIVRRHYTELEYEGYNNKGNISLIGEYQVKNKPYEIILGQ